MMKSGRNMSMCCDVRGKDQNSNSLFQWRCFPGNILRVFHDWDMWKPCWFNPYHASPGQWTVQPTVAHCGWKSIPYLSIRGENSTHCIVGQTSHHGIHVSSELRWTGFILRGLRHFNGCCLPSAEIYETKGRIVASDCHHLVLHLAIYHHLPANFVVSRRWVISPQFHRVS